MCLPDAVHGMGRVRPLPVGSQLIFIDVKADHLDLFRKFHGQGQADVTQAYHAELALPFGQFVKIFIFLVPSFIFS